jgi:hypothetical protein
MAGLSEKTATWVASVLANECPTKYGKSVETADALKARGLYMLRTADLKALWNRLKMEPWVHSDARCQISNAAAKDQWVEHVQRFLMMPGASQLARCGNGIGIGNSSSAPAIPNVAAGNPTPPGATMPVINPPAMASVQQMAYPYPQAVAYSYQSQTMNPPQIPYASYPPYPSAETMHPPQKPYASYPPYPSAAMIVTAGHDGRPMFNFARYATTSNPAFAATPVTVESNDRKRKAPPSGSHPKNKAGPSASPNNHWGTGMCESDELLFDDGSGDDALAAVFQESIGSTGSAGSSLSDTSAVSPGSLLQLDEQRILTELKQQWGFSDDKECVDAIQRVKRQSAALTTDAVMLEIISQREEAEETKKMDLARLASELDSREESQRLRDQRKQDDEEKILNATYQEMKNPSSAENKRLMFEFSWLLRYEDCAPLLLEIADKQTHRTTKRSLIQLLQKERDAKKWYNNDLPKSWFTFVAGKRILDAFAKGGTEALMKELDFLTEEVNEATCLQSQQNKEGIPLIFLNAKDQHQPPTETGDDNNDDSDDDIKVLDEAEIRRERESILQRSTGENTAAVLEIS